MTRKKVSLSELDYEKNVRNYTFLMAGLFHRNSIKKLLSIERTYSSIELFYRTFNVYVKSEIQ